MHAWEHGQAAHGILTVVEGMDVAIVIAGRSVHTWWPDNSGCTHTDGTEASSPYA